MPARNSMLPTASSDAFVPPPTVFAAEGAKPQQSFPLALLGSGRCGSCMPARHSLPSRHIVLHAPCLRQCFHCNGACALVLGPPLHEDQCTQRLA